jgi:hypothetical protein
MKTEQAMNNLWAKSALRREAVSMHSENMAAGQTIPTKILCQRIDLAGHSRVIPLRGASY